MFAQTDLNKLVAEVGGSVWTWGPPLVGFFLSVLAMGIVLRTTCSLFNSMVGGKDAAEGIPMPSLIGCMFLILVSGIVGLVVAYAVIWAAGTLAASIQMNPSEAIAYASMASLPIWFLVLTMMLAFFLPTSIFRGFVISLLCVPVAVVLLFLFWFLVWLVSAAFGVMHPALQKLPFIK